jgi:thiol-disulfide isomerase/thioredoxin
MNKKFPFFLALLFASLFAQASGGYDIKVRIAGLRDTICYLGNHYGDKQYVRDTVHVDHNGWAEFKGKEDLPGGIYLVVMPNKTYFEILITADEQKFSIETDTADFVTKFEVKGSQENKLFNEHQRFIVSKTKDSQDLRNRYEANKDNKDSVKVLKEKISAVDKEVKDYRLKLMADNPKSFMTKIFMAMRDPEVPDAPKDANGNVLDSAFGYHYYKAHYWDYVDFSDDRLLRTPILQNKIKTYTTQLTPQIPDSIIESVNLIIDKAEANKEVFKYCVATLANYYETSNIMGFDKVFVDIAERYYLVPEKAYWADDSLRKKIEERVNKIKPNILGTPAYNLEMPDTAFKIHKLYDVVADYTVLVFWDPTCSHCKKEIPLLAAYYDSVKAAGLKLEIYAIGIESDMDLWKNYVKEHNLKWINVSDLYNNTHFRNYYDIYSTPVIYLLDDKKRIIAKRLDTEKLRDFIDNYRKLQK